MQGTVQHCRWVIRLCLGSLSYHRRGESKASDLLIFTCSLTVVDILCSIMAKDALLEMI